MIYVMSDIHGNRAAFDDILAQIQLQAEDELYVLGDVIDRNPYGMEILLELIQMRQAKVLLGNHEHMMLDVLDHPGDKMALERWYSNGGEISHRMFDDLPEMLQRRIVNFLRRAPVNVSVQAGDQEYLLVHGMPIYAYDREVHNLVYGDLTTFSVWDRMDADWKPQDKRVVVFGHTPTAYYQRRFPMEIWYGEGTIGIDCGAAYSGSGRLCCLRLDDNQVFYSAV